jgi:hypothetical protein
MRLGGCARREKEKEAGTRRRGRSLGKGTEPREGGRSPGKGDGAPKKGDGATVEARKRVLRGTSAVAC